jgi:hypothetical protein
MQRTPIQCTGSITFGRGTTSPQMITTGDSMMQRISCLISCLTITFVFTSPTPLVKYDKTHILSDTELTKWEKPLDAIVSKMKRLPRPSSSSGETTRHSRTDVSSVTGTVNAPRFKKRKFTTPEPSSSNSHDFKRKKTIRDDTPLTDGERRFIDQNIARGGGIIVSEAVQNKVAWIKEAMERKLCIRCAGTGHILDECEATRQSNSWGSTSKPSLNAIFPGTEDLNEITQS